MDRDDGFLLFKGMVDKEEDLDPSVRDEMLKKEREYFYAGPNIGFYKASQLAVACFS